MTTAPSEMNLSNATLHHLDDSVRVPVYDRSRLAAHTVHIGVGGFHRAHQAVYLDDLLHLDPTNRWGECGLGILKSDDRMRNALTAQNCLYTLVERSAAAQNARVIGSMVDYVYAPDDSEIAIEAMAAPECRIVSLTITEGGYFLDDSTGQFQADDPDLQSDLSNPAQPKTALGYLTEALDRRRRRNLPSFTVMSCDNLQGNGNVIKMVLLAFAEQRNGALRSWIEQNVTFPNSMVDRITPATTPADIDFVRTRFHVADAWPVVTEPFRQWVIEDEFCAGRPAWETVGAQLTHDVAPYEIMKMRLLNGSHMAMAYLGALAGYRFAHQVMQDPIFVEFITQLMEEVTPVVPAIPGVSIAEYKTELLQRFSNPTINDQVTRLCSEGSAKLPKWIIPSIIELMQAGHSTKRLVLVIASWIFYLRGQDQHGNALDIIDARKEELIRLARQCGVDPRSFLAVTYIFGQELPQNATFVEDVQQALRTLATIGPTATIRKYLNMA